MTFYLVPCLKTCRLASLLVRRGLWFQNVCLQMHPSSCAGSVVSFKTQWISSLVNLAHVYPVSGVVAERVASQTMLPCLTTCRLAMLVRRGLWLHQRRINLPLQLPRRRVSSGFQDPYAHLVQASSNACPEGLYGESCSDSPPFFLPSCSPRRQPPPQPSHILPVHSCCDDSSSSSASNASLTFPPGEIKSMSTDFMRIFSQNKA